MTLEEVRSFAQDRFADIIEEIIEPSPEKVRFVLQDGSFVDIRISQRAKNRFDFHWERRHVDGTIYRYDNFPDMKFKRLKTFPHHLHRGKEEVVISAPFRRSLPYAFLDFMEFVRIKLQGD